MFKHEPQSPNARLSPAEKAFWQAEVELAGAQALLVSTGDKRLKRQAKATIKQNRIVLGLSRPKWVREADARPDDETCPCGGKIVETEKGAAKVSRLVTTYDQKGLIKRKNGSPGWLYKCSECGHQNITSRNPDPLGLKREIAQVSQPEIGKGPDWEVLEAADDKCGCP